MPSEIPIQAVAAIGTIGAALITACISFVNLTLSKEQKTSEFRQAWIDALRNDLAAFFSVSRAFARFIEAEKRISNPHPGQKSVFGANKLEEFRHTAAETFYRIKLRLNPNEVEHSELLRLIEAAISAQNDFLSSSSANPKDVLSAIDRAADYSCPVLKLEWNRVKKGELAFRLARNWIAPAIVLIAIAFMVFVLFGKFKA